MNDLNPFEQEIKQVYRLPEATPAFLNRLEARLQAHRLTPKAKAKPTFHFARGWSFAKATPILIGVILIAVGPSKVLAQIQAVLGFVPGAGVVDTSSPFRQLAAPVSDTNDGVTLTIQSAFLSADQTIFTYTMPDLPAEIKRARFGDPECFMPANLILPDGSKLEATGSSGGLAPDGSFVHEIRFSSAIPANFNEAILVFPCLEGTAQGKGPVDWQIALAFKPAPDDMVVYPATLIPPQAKVEDPVASPGYPAAQPRVESETPAMPAMIVDGDRQEDMVVLGVVEKTDAYWVTWAYPFKINPEIQVNGQLSVSPFNPVLYDAHGVELPEADHDTQLELWKYEDSLRNQLPEQDRMNYAMTMHTFIVPKLSVAFPVYVRLNVYERSFPEKEAFAEVEFDGSKVQSSDKPVEINQEIQIGSVKFRLNTIEKNEYGGYTFVFDGAEGKVIQCRLELVGHPTNMSGNSSLNPGDPFHFDQSVMYRQIPAGKLTVRISQPAVMGDLVSFTGSWSPEK